jgi:hypothetical protein
MLTVVRQVYLSTAMRELDVYHLIAFCLHDACRRKDRTPTEWPLLVSFSWSKKRLHHFTIRMEGAEEGSRALRVPFPDCTTKRKGRDRQVTPLRAPARRSLEAVSAIWLFVQRHTSRRCNMRRPSRCIVAGTTDHRSAFFGHGHQSRSLQGEGKTVHNVGRARGGLLQPGSASRNCSTIAADGTIRRDAGRN